MQFQQYFGINQALSRIEDLQRGGTIKTNKLYRTLLGQPKNDENNLSKFCLTLASSFCWVPVYDRDENFTDGFQNKFMTERALYEIEPAVKGLLLAIQTKMNLLFPPQRVNNIARIEIEKEVIDFQESAAELQRRFEKNVCEYFNGIFKCFLS